MQTAKGYPAPDFTKLLRGHAEYRNEFNYALNYANYMFEHSDLRKAVESYAKSNFSHIPDYEFAFIGQLAWLVNSGGYVEQATLDQVNYKINVLRAKYTKAPPVVKKPIDNTGKALEDLEGLIDDAVLNRLSDIVKPSEIFKKYDKVDYSKIEKHFKEVLDAAPLDFEDNPKLMKLITLVVSSILKAIEEIGGATAKPRKSVVRKARKITPDKLVRKMVYCKDNKETGLTSIPPEKIIGAETLWVFNVKTRKLGRYIAESSAGLSVKGTSITGFAPDYSVQKTLRKPKETLTELIGAGKVQQRKFIDGIKATAGKLTGRINSDTILVKVY